ncbi:hypothetical protein RFI_23063 [Reticulomyxa filosa]|uniref:Uncharacterized protein n=1 Tax=Reticulomyxa filosa TaxID=46433 RepID=X6MMJ9_RETFI|nr:hypothetical protein RFI_23063 [Reticulomyxa filosa]|eukprot:ETO14305.1 hypothetical protein RFI_23063 [Reticulomyxa filosa]
MIGVNIVSCPHLLTFFVVICFFFFFKKKNKKKKTNKQKEKKEVSWVLQLMSVPPAVNDGGEQWKKKTDSNVQDSYTQLQNLPFVGPPSSKGFASDVEQKTLREKKKCIVVLYHYYFIVTFFFFFENAYVCVVVSGNEKQTTTEADMTALVKELRRGSSRNLRKELDEADSFPNANMNPIEIRLENAQETIMQYAEVNQNLKNKLTQYETAFEEQSRKYAVRCNQLRTLVNKSAVKYSNFKTFFICHDLRHEEGEGGGDRNKRSKTNKNHVICKLNEQRTKYGKLHKKYDEKMIQEKEGKETWKEGNESNEGKDSYQTRVEYVQKELKMKCQELESLKEEKENMLASITKENILLKTSYKELMDSNDHLKQQIKVFETQIAEGSVFKEEVMTLKIELKNFERKEHENIIKVEHLNQQILELSHVHEKYEAMSRDFDQMQIKHKEFQEEVSRQHHLHHDQNKETDEKIAEYKRLVIAIMLKVKQNIILFIHIFIYLNKEQRREREDWGRGRIKTHGLYMLEERNLIDYCKPNSDLDELINICVSKLTDKTHQLEQRCEKLNSIINITLSEKEVQIRAAVTQEMNTSLKYIICRSIVSDLISNVVASSALDQRRMLSNHMAMGDKLALELKLSNSFFSPNFFFLITVNVLLHAKKESISKEKMRLEKLSAELMDRERIVNKNQSRLEGQMKIIKCQRKAIEMLVSEVDEKNQRCERLREQYVQMNEINETDERFQNEQLKELTDLLNEKQQECNRLIETTHQLQSSCSLTEQELNRFRQASQQREKEYQAKMEALQEQTGNLTKQTTLLQMELKHREELLKDRDSDSSSQSKLAFRVCQEKYSELITIKDKLVVDYEACQKELQKSQQKVLLHQYFFLKSRSNFLKKHEVEEVKQALTAVQEQLKNEHARWSNISRENEQLLTMKESYQDRLNPSKNKIAQLQAECNNFKNLYEELKKQGQNQNVQEMQQLIKTWENRCKDETCNPVTELKQRIEAEKQAKQYQTICQEKELKKEHIKAYPPFVANSYTDEEIANLKKQNEEGRQRRQQLREMIENTRKEAQEKIQKSSESYRVMKNIALATYRKLLSEEHFVSGNAPLREHLEYLTTELNRHGARTPKPNSHHGNLITSNKQ